MAEETGRGQTHRYGSLVGDDDTGGILNTAGAVLTTTIATAGLPARPALITVGPTQHTGRPAMVALELAGRLADQAGEVSDDSLSALYLLPLDQLDQLVAGLIEAAHTAGGAKASAALIDSVIAILEALPEP